MKSKSLLSQALRSKFLYVVSILFIAVGVNAQDVPEIIYYKFDQSGSNVENHADPGSGADAFGTVEGAASVGGSGQFGMALEGGGGTGDRVVTGWGGTLDQDWTISMWWNNIPLSTTHYILGDVDNLNSFRLYILSGSISLRGTGLTLQPSYDIPSTGPHVFHWVHNAGSNEINFYVDGQLEQTYSSGGATTNIGNMMVGAYTTGSSLQPGSFIDEFRFYDRALSAQEVSETWDIELGIDDGPPTADFYAPSTMYTGGSYQLRSEHGADTYEWRVNGIFVSSDRAFNFTPDSAGTYDITLYMLNEEGDDELTRSIVVIDPTGPPEANFFASRNQIIQQQVTVNDESLYRGVVELYDYSTQGAHTFQWEVTPETFDLPAGGGFAPAYHFRDGNNLQSKNTELLFVRPGTYNVMLTASNDFGSDIAVKEDYLTVSHMMCSEIETFNATTDFQGVLTDNESTANYSEAECGFVISPCAQDMYIVFDQFELECGEDFLRIYDGVDDTGIPLFGACQDNGHDGFTGAFDPEVVADLECSPEDMCLPPDTLWSSTGTFYVEFDAGSNANNLQGFQLRWNSSEKTTPARASFEVPETACTGAEVIFENTSSGEGIEAFAWDYQGDGIINDSNTTGSYAYTIPDTYSPRLFVRDCAGLVDTFESEITVISPADPPLGTINTSNPTPWADQDTVEVFAEFENCITDWEWNISPAGHFTFVEGYNRFSERPKIVFRESGCFDVSITAENSEGQTVTSETCLIDVRKHCRPLLGQSSTDIGVSRTRVGGMDHSRSPGESIYSDYSGEEELQVDLEIGETYTITLSRLSNSNPMSRAVWIDYTRNGTFTDSLELVAYESNAQTATYSATFTVPGHAEPGETRIRIGTGYGSELLRPCGGIQVGEYVDYRVVIHQDTEAPELTLLGDNPMTVHVFDTYIEPGAEAWDPAYGDLTGQIQIDNSEVDSDVVGTYTVYYSVTDNAGNVANKERTVIVQDTVSPDLTLLGDNPLQAEVNTDFEEPGYNISDNYWPESELDVSLTTDLDMSELGDYTIEYCVSDGSGNQSCVVREVEVLDTTPPEIVLPAGAVRAEVKEPFEMPDIPVIDNYWSSDDIDVTYSEFVNFPDELGLIEVEITATDGSGNTSTAVLLIEVVDTTPPDITLNGNSYMFVPRYADFNDPGVNITDNYDPNPDLHTSGTFQGSDMRPGLYNRSYYAVDQSGNISDIVVRTIEVGEPTALSATGEAGYRMYPNPVKDVLNIDVVGASREFTLTVSDISGRTVKTAVIEAGGSTYLLDMSDFEPGMFIISLTDGTEVFKERILLTD